MRGSWPSSSVDFNADTNIRAMVTELQDTSLLARIVDVGDLIAREAKYHLKCLVNLRNRYRSHLRKSSHHLQGINEWIKSIVGAHKLHWESCELRNPLIAVIRHSLHVCESSWRLWYHKTRLKVNLLEKFPEAQEQHDGNHCVWRRDEEHAERSPQEAGLHRRCCNTR